jgi:hypothetical protein
LGDSQEPSRSPHRKEDEMKEVLKHRHMSKGLEGVRQKLKNKGYPNKRKSERKYPPRQ